MSAMQNDCLWLDTRVDGCCAMADEAIDKNLFFQHTDCEYFPCHDGVPAERFNCMLCYCPMYALGSACGGNFVLSRRGVKNCKDCSIPHDGDSGVRLVKERFKELANLAARESGITIDWDMK